MKTLKQYLTEAAESKKNPLTQGTFKSEDYDKHQFKYSKAVIDDLLAGKKLRLGKSDQTVSIDDFDHQKLIDIRKDIENTTRQQFNDAYHGKLTTIWSKIAKKPYSGSHANEDITGSELAVLVYIDAIISKQDVNDITNYKPTDRLHCDPKLIDNVVMIISTDKSWQRSCLATAKAIISKIPQAKTYQLHYRDKVYNTIRELGNRLGGFKGKYDRWNPADAMLVKKGAFPINNEYTSNIVDFNNYIGKCEDVIGISLKKSDKEAMQGSVSLGTILGELPQLKVAVTKYKDVKSTFPVVHNQLKKLQNSKIADLIYCSGVGSDVHKRIVADNNADDIKLRNGTFVNSIPNVLEFLIAACDDKDVFIDICNMCYLWAASRTPKSCNFYKASESGCKFVDVHTAVDFKLNKIVIPLDGSSRITFDITVDGNYWSMIARAKQERGFPQFVIEHKQLKTTALKPIRQVDL